MVVTGHVGGAEQTVGQMDEIRSLWADSKNGDFRSSNKKE